MNTAAYSGLNSHAQRKLAEALRDPQYNPVVILGDGQIAMMQVQECQRRQIPVIVIGDGSYAIQSLHSPAEQALGQDDYYINLGEDYLGRPSELDQLIEKLKITRSAVTAEFENVPVELLELFEKQGVRLAPGSKAFAICRDKLMEKKHFRGNGIPCTDFLELQADDLESQRSKIEELLPGFVKIRTLGYDGKGQELAGTFEDVKRILTQDLLKDGKTKSPFKRTPCILEKKVDFAYEMSVILLRDKDGKIVIGGVSKNFQDNGILVASAISEDMIPQQIKDEAISYAIKAANGMSYEGLLVVEFFVDKNGTVQANEMAPRPHNSGHHTIEGMYTSQYALQALLAHGPQTIASIMKAYSTNHVQLYDRIQYREVVSRHAHIGLVNILGTTLRGVSEVLGIASFGPRGGMPNVTWGAQHIATYGKPDGKDTKRGHAVVSAVDQVQLLQYMNLFVSQLHPQSKFPW